MTSSRRSGSTHKRNHRIRNDPGSLRIDESRIIPAKAWMMVRTASTGTTYRHPRGSGNDAIDVAVVDAPTVIPAIAALSSYKVLIKCGNHWIVGSTQGVFAESRPGRMGESTEQPR